MYRGGMHWRGTHWHGRRNNCRLVLDPGKVLRFVLMDLQSGEELSVVVLHREAEMRSIVGPHHLGIVAAGLLGCARSASGAVIVRGDREWPVAESFIIRAQQFRGRLGLAGWVEAIIVATLDG